MLRYAEKNTGKKSRTEGRHRAFYLDWSAATLLYLVSVSEIRVP